MVTLTQTEKKKPPLLKPSLIMPKYFLFVTHGCRVSRKKGEWPHMSCVDLQLFITNKTGLLTCLGWLVERMWDRLLRYQITQIGWHKASRANVISLLRISFYSGNFLSSSLVRFNMIVCDLLVNGQMNEWTINYKEVNQEQMTFETTNECPGTVWRLYAVEAQAETVSCIHTKATVSH